MRPQARTVDAWKILSLPWENGSGHSGCGRGCRRRSSRRGPGWAGLDRTYYAGIERGERNPSVKQLAKIAAALAVPIAALFSEGESPA